MDKGKRILFKTFWNAQGWTYQEPLPEELEIAIREGYMFKLMKALGHDEMLAEIRNVTARISPQDVADAFLYSLSTRRLEYRSCLGSYWFARGIPVHSAQHSDRCWYCGWCPDFCAASTRAHPQWHDANIWNFHRYKFGTPFSLRQAEYALFDLKQFLKQPKVMPKAEDRMLLRRMLMAMTELPSDKKAGAYRDLLVKKKIIPGNKREISEVLSILGLCGVLSSTEHPAPCVEYRGMHGLDPVEYRNDFMYPASYWRVRDGINEGRFAKTFGISWQEF